MEYRFQSVWVWQILYSNGKCNTQQFFGDHERSGRWSIHSLGWCIKSVLCSQQDVFVSHLNLVVLPSWLICLHVWSMEAAACCSQAANCPAALAGCLLRRYSCSRCNMSSKCANDEKAKGKLIYNIHYNRSCCCCCIRSTNVRGRKRELLVLLRVFFPPLQITNTFFGRFHS